MSGIIEASGVGRCRDKKVTCVGNAAVEQVLAELRALRKRSGGVTVEAVATKPTLTRLLGAGDPSLAYTRLQHHLLGDAHERSIKAAAASLGFSSAADTHLGRLEDAGQALSVDQRQARRLSDEGLRAIAARVASSWLVEAVPSLSLAVIAEPLTVRLLLRAEWPAIIEMERPVVSLYVGAGEPRMVPAEWQRRQKGDRAVLSTLSPLSIPRSPDETSVGVTWRGEVWPKFACRLHGTHSDISVESLANRLMIRLWGGDEP